MVSFWIARDPITNPPYQLGNLRAHVRFALKLHVPSVPDQNRRRIAHYRLETARSPAGQNVSSCLLLSQCARTQPWPIPSVVEHHSGKGFGEAFIRMGIVPERSWVDSNAEEVAAKADAAIVAVGYRTDSERRKGGTGPSNFLWAE